ncbi:MAG: transcriptional repressor [Candidatus Eisenbacteria bacterium]|nr:transcriptional repressor [Candidatus Eisenbacteria bacterium]
MTKAAIHRAARQRLDLYLRERGLRRTSEREELLDCVLGIPGHFGPDEVLSALKRAGYRASLATIYRNLPVLCAAGILRRTCLSSGEMRYERALGAEHHDHLICEQCSTVVEFQYEAIEVLQEAVAERYGFELTNHHLELIGRCRACRDAAEDRRVAP